MISDSELYRGEEDYFSSIKNRKKTDRNSQDYKAEEGKKKECGEND